MTLRLIEVVSYNSDWPIKYEEERTLLHQTLGQVAQQIHHIGSTSVPGLAAKPIIDILLEVPNLTELDLLNDKMVSIGYDPKGEFGIAGRRYYPKGGLDRTHQIHAFETGMPNVIRHLAFRDYLRVNTDIAQAYAELKRQVVSQCNNDIMQYSAGKDAFIKEHEAKAVQHWKTKVASR